MKFSEYVAKYSSYGWRDEDCIDVIPIHALNDALNDYEVFNKNLKNGLLCANCYAVCKDSDSECPICEELGRLEDTEK